MQLDSFCNASQVPSSIGNCNENNNDKRNADIVTSVINSKYANVRSPKLVDSVSIAIN